MNHCKKKLTISDGFKGPLVVDKEFMVTDLLNSVATQALRPANQKKNTLLFTTPIFEDYSGNTCQLGKSRSNSWLLD